MRSLRFNKLSSTMSVCDITGSSSSVGDVTEGCAVVDPAVDEATGPDASEFKDSRVLCNELVGEEG